ncbi:hypothetical protein B0H17DRAFT_244735 [Mycena rosella]|uniref:Phosphatidic acid phosphatase type 2/haloperoxidase domain-containing protein n=1 Tax=Mycena rosella TaxID=1033263 RepID=A0AAD7MBT6_MYCRO|nr:hypothetical protein B0H17DRAFT_244735 [Mycena rosella]
MFRPECFHVLSRIVHCTIILTLLYQLSRTALEGSIIITDVQDYLFMMFSSSGILHEKGKTTVFHYATPIVLTLALISMASTSWERPWWLSFLDRTNFTVTALTAAAILFTRSACVAYLGAGALACSLSVKVLKRGIRQPRPALRQTKKTYGMPSTHAASISFYATFIPLACIYLPLHPSVPAGAMARVLVPAVTIPWAVLIVLSRVWLGHHNWAQVAVGCAYGVGFAGVWFALWTRGLDEYGRMAEELVESFVGRR